MTQELSCEDKQSFFFFFFYELRLFHKGKWSLIHPYSSCLLQDLRWSCTSAETLPGANPQYRGHWCTSMSCSTGARSPDRKQNWMSTYTYQWQLTSDTSLERKIWISDLLHNVAHAIYILDLILLAGAFESPPECSLAKKKQQISKLSRPLT